MVPATKHTFPSDTCWLRSGHFHSFNRSRAAFWKSFVVVKLHNRLWKDGKKMVTEGVSLRGECLCRSVGYEVFDAFEYALICHCSDCRRQTGSAFKPFGGIATDPLNLVRGQDQLSLYGDERGHDAHCKQCGSLLDSLVRDGKYVHVTFGSLVDVPSIFPSAHIYVGSKAPSHTICDGLLQYDELPPE
jgi:hypothetical protein